MKIKNSWIIGLVMSTFLVAGYVSARPTSGGAAPSNLIATAVSASRINLTWNDNSGNESQFRIERGLSSTTFAEIASVSANSTAYADTGLTAGTTYYYRVRAVKLHRSRGEIFSEYSNAAKATTYSIRPPPLAPSNLTATAGHNDRGWPAVDLAWQDNADNENWIEIERATDGYSDFMLIGSVVENSTAYQDVGMAAGILYHYRVRAQNEAGPSDYSNTASATALW